MVSRAAVGVRRGLAIAALLVAGSAALIALTWPTAPFAIAAFAAEKPPEILLDFDYPERMESRAFAERFSAGTAAGEMIAWLEHNDFEIGSGPSATRTYESVPCTYTYNVSWRSDGAVLQRDAVARLDGYGCL